MLFEEGSEARATTIKVAAKGAGPVVKSTESRPPSSGALAKAASCDKIPKGLAYQEEVSRFCSAVRVGRSLLVGPDHAIGPARACIRANESVKEQQRLAI